ncbi:MAG: hypothetical protein IPM48_10515 [Saprospiraceae bacterium]|nr:hypothetical protein [Saprospiraceae bacterium]
MKNYYFLISVLFFALSCQKKAVQELNNNVQSFENYISGIQAGHVRLQEGVKIFFSQSPVTSDNVGIDLPKGLIDIHPKLEGHWNWSNAYTLSFTPELSFIPNPDQKYTVKLQMHQLFNDLPDSLKILSFDFVFILVQAQVKWSFLKSDPSNENHMTLEANVQFSDFVDSITRLQFIRIDKPKNSNIKLNLSQNPDGSWLYQFQQINRGPTSQELLFSWDTDFGNSENRVSHHSEIPSATEFVITGVETEQLDERLVQIYFSDPLDRTQDFKSFVKLNQNFNLVDIRSDNDILHLRIKDSNPDEACTISLLKGLKSINGKMIVSEFSHQVLGRKQKPKLRLLSSGNILPFTDQLVLPFEAINLQKVDVEIFKIFSSNVLFNFHMDFGNEPYNLVKLGRIVHQQTIELNPTESGDNRRLWKTYALELSKMIKPEPGALYDVRLSFRPEYSDYDCANQLSNLVSSQYEDYSGSSKFSSRWNQWGYYEYEDEQGERCYNSEDPCCPYYYSSRNFARRLVMASNIALIAKKSPEFDAHYIFARNLMTGEPLSGAEIKFYDPQLQCIFTGTTDGLGKLIFQSNSEANIVTARHKDHHAYLRLDQGRNLPMSEFDVNGSSSQQGLKIFNYTERGVWRPGDTILFGSIVYQPTQSIPIQMPLQIQLKNPSGKVVQEQSLQQNLFGHYTSKIPTRPDYVTGDYQLSVKAGSVVVTKSIKIETVKPNRYKVEYNTDLVWPFAQDWPPLKPKTSFLHGAPAAGKKFTVDMIYSTKFPEFKEFKSFQFYDPEKPLQAGVEQVADTQLDEQGVVDFKYPLDRSQFTNDLKVVLESKVIEEGEVSTDYFEHEVKMHQKYIGSKFSSTEFGQYFPVQKPVFMEFACVDENGKGLANERLILEVFLVDGNWWYEVRNNRSFVSEGHQKKLVHTADLKTDSKGYVKTSFTPTEYERYYVRVRSEKTAHTSGLNFYSGWDYGDEDGNHQSEYIQVLKLQTEKEKYLPGETAAISLPGALNGQYLIHIVKDNKIIKSETIKANKSKTDYKFSVVEGMEPNVYLDISLIQPVSGQNVDLPIRMFGIVPVIVENAKRRIEPLISTADVFKPGKKVQIEISEKSGKEMAYQLYLVEEGLLGLTRFKTPDPYSWFFQKESMNLYTWDNYNQVIGSTNGIFQGVFSIGGDQGIDPTQLSKMKRFKPLALTTQLASLKPNSKNKHEFELPNYNGSVRIMAVANNQSAFGFAEKIVPVKAELMCDILFPRVVAVQDEISVPVSITTTDEKVKEVVVTIKTPKLMKLIGTPSQTLKFEKVGEKKVFFKLSGKGTIGPDQLEVNAVSGTLSSQGKVDFFVDNPNPLVHRLKEYWIEPGQSVTEDLTAFGSPGTRKNTLSVGVFSGKSFEDMRHQLIHYPHGCAEQTTSIAFAQLYLDRIIELDAKTKLEINSNVRTAIQKLAGFQKSNGGFSYWQHDANPSDYVSSFIGHFLLEAKRLGYQIPPNTLENWKDYQLKNSRNFEIKNSDYGDFLRYNQAYRLYSLAMASSPDWTGMNQMNQSKEKPMMAQWMLAGAYAHSGKKDLAKGMLKNLEEQVQPYHDSYFHFGSHIRDEAVIAMILNDLDLKSEAMRLMKKLMANVKASNYLSTQEMAFILLSCGKIYAGKQLSGNDIKFDYKWGDISKSIQTELSSYSCTLTDGEKIKYTLVNRSQIPLSFQMIQYGKSEEEKILDESNVLQLKVNYLDEFGKSVDIRQVNQSDRLVAHLQISHNGSAGYLRNLALTAAFPSCFEINNQRIGNLNPDNPKVKNTDYRDDRVYFYFDLGARESIHFKIPLIAASVGKFMSPDFFVEAMYDPSIYARINKGRVVVQPVK